MDSSSVATPTNWDGFTATISRFFKNGQDASARPNSLTFISSRLCPQCTVSVRALHRAGIVAVTSPAGALNADKADWRDAAYATFCFWTALRQQRATTAGMATEANAVP